MFLWDLGFNNLAYAAPMGKGDLMVCLFQSTKFAIGLGWSVLLRFSSGAEIPTARLQAWIYVIEY